MMFKCLLFFLFPLRLLSFFLKKKEEKKTLPYAFNPLSKLFSFPIICYEQHNVVLCGSKMYLKTTFDCE